MHFIFAISINTSSSNNRGADFIKRLLAKNDLSRMKVFELCICALACISLATCMSIINKLKKQPEHETQLKLNSCIIEAGLTYDDAFDVRDIINNNIDKPELEEKKQKHGCVIECILRQMTWMEGSELKEDKLYADINKVFASHVLNIQIEETVRDCVRKVKHATQERCEKGVVAMKCAIKGAHRLFPSSMLKLNEENENN